MNIRDKIKNYQDFSVEVAKIIGYTDVDCPITPMLNTKWSISDGYINFDRYKTGDMWEYGILRISSLAMKHEIYFMGEEDGLHFIMAYPEDEIWDDSEIFIFDEKNKIDWEEDY